MQSNNGSMKKFTLFLSLLFFVFRFLFFSQDALAQEPSQIPNLQQEYYTGTVIKILNQKETTIDGMKSLDQNVVVQLQDGPQQGQMITIDNGYCDTTSRNRR